MIDLESLTARMAKMKEYLGYLNEYRQQPFETVKSDHTLQGALLHYLQLAIECAVDMGEMIISGNVWRKPEEARDIIDILAEHEVFPNEFAQKISPMIGFRNLLVHEYIRIDLERVYRHLPENLADLDDYTRHIAVYVQGGD